MEMQERELQTVEPSSGNLHHAVINAEDGVIARIESMRENPSLNEVDHYGYTPLHCAAKYGHYNILNSLLRNGANSRDPTRDEKFTVLHILALQRGGAHEELSRLLSEDNQNIIAALVEITDAVKCNPLHVACREGNVVVIDIIMTHCSRDSTMSALQSCNDNTETPLHEACRSGIVTIMKKIETIYNSSQDFLSALTKNVVKCSPIHIACREGSVDLMKHLVNELKNEENFSNLISVHDKDKKTPLHYACELEDNAIAALLLDNGAEISSDKDGITPFHIAAQYGSLKVAKKLLEKPEAANSLNARDMNYETPLFYAARYRKDKMVDFLLKQHAKSDVVNKELHTPLLCAAIRGYHKVCAALMDNNASIKDVDACGKNIIHIAAEKDHTIFLEEVSNFQNLDEETKQRIMNSSDKDSNTPLHLAAEKGNSGCVEVLLKDDFVNKEAKNKHRWTPMHYAAAAGHIQNQNGHTPLHLAAKYGHEDIVLLLFKVISGISPDKLDKLVNPPEDQISPLHLAIDGGHLSVVKFLIKNTFKIAQIDLVHPSSGLTPIEAAINLNHKSIVSAIVESDEWEEAMKSDKKEKEEYTIFKELIKEMPDIACEVLDRCINKEDEKTFNFQYVEGQPQTSTNGDQEEREGLSSQLNRRDYKNHPLQLMVDYNRKSLLQHDLTTAFISSKRKTFGSYFVVLLFYIIFVALLTAFALVSPNPQDATCQAIISGQFGKLKDLSNISLHNTSNGCILLNETSAIQDFSIDVWTTEDVCNNFTLIMECGYNEECGLCSNASYEIEYNKVAAIIIFIMGVIQLVIEGLQFYTQKLRYLRGYSNYIDLALFITTVLFTSSAFLQCGCPRSWQWQLGIAAVFLAWIDLLLFLRYFPKYGIHVLMFGQILRTFLGTILLAVTLVVAFSITFFMIFNVPSLDYARSPFSNPLRAHFKLMAMTIGEIDFNSLFRLSSESANSDNNISELPFLWATYIFWILFLVLMPILLSNLLTALAIYDVKEIQEESKIEALNLKIEFLLNIEGLWWNFKRFRLKFKNLRQDTGRR